MSSLKQTHGGKHFLHIFSPAEQYAYNALVYQYNHMDSKPAEKSCRSASKIEPGYFHPHFILGSVLLRSNATAAEDAFRKALSIFTGSCETRLFLSIVLGAMGKHSEALDELRTIQLGCPKFAPAYAAEAGLPPAAGDNKRIAVLMEKAIAANPYYAPGLMEAGRFRMESEDYSLAGELFRRCVSILPRSASANYGLAAALNSLGNESESIHYFVEAIRLSPDTEEIVRSFLEIPLKYYKSGDAKTAIELLDRSLDAAPGQPDILFWMVRIQERANGKQAALPFRRQLAESDVKGKYKRYHN
jgi:hypothetical protein